ncbi:tRNA-U20a,U20b-dihydrouridine synthase [Verrucomicrobium sp. GAS474]|uniref:tRNA dihydrouridine synthase n=1 Tax=Verrucomicrobium sp. GAS474 TaxID=1882831 RepID=UPI00087CC054|nr:tRNA-dihydrouridine synthase family protein [Verrucomicrobium sp. GAS474]SDU11097.1 tRNA-U20a,U20b-dihydrouridine synthase [Verrucomicrobium sp. GAS474]
MTTHPQIGNLLQKAAKAGNCPLLILAPMQDVTDLPFMRVMERYGGPDLYYTEYFRVHGDSKPEKWIVRSIRECPGGKPVIAQVIGQDIPALVRTAQALEREPVVGIDLNLGCPAPIVCRKKAGGGLLRHVAEMEKIVAALRGAVAGPFTVKTRIGFDGPGEFDALLDVFTRYPIDALTVHGRTVREMYRTAVHYDRIAEAVRRMDAPVFANGNVLSVRLARETITRTGAAGLMIGRGAIRNPWIFTQIRQAWAGEAVYRPTLRDLRGYIEALFEATNHEGFKETLHVAKMKKYLNFIGQGVDAEEAFLREIRCAERASQFFAVCDRFLDRDGTVPDEPPAGALFCPRSEALASSG